MLCQFTADACQRPVVAGPIEATAIGNILMQAIGTGQLSSIEEARQLVRSSPDIVHYAPQSIGRWDEGFEKFKQYCLS
jgi:rhamnulokinase